jgi:Tfp pilus assembly protein PilV
VTRRDRRGERGSTMIEVMVATSILIIAAVGFGGTSQYAATSTGIGHRRTVATFIRGELIDRLEVVPRSVLRGVAAANEGVWVLDACYDFTVKRTASNGTYSAAFTCPVGSAYRSWIRVTDNGADAWAATTNMWTVGIYVERTARGCTAANREASVDCLSADLLLTD